MKEFELLRRNFSDTGNFGAPSLHLAAKPDGYRICFCQPRAWSRQAGDYGCGGGWVTHVVRKHAARARKLQTPRGRYLNNCVSSHRLRHQRAHRPRD